MLLKYFAIKKGQKGGGQGKTEAGAWNVRGGSEECEDREAETWTSRRLPHPGNPASSLL